MPLIAARSFASRLRRRRSVSCCVEKRSVAELTYVMCWSRASSAYAAPHRDLLARRRQQKLHRPPERAKAGALVEQLGAVLVVGADEELLEIARGRDRGRDQGAATPAAATVAAHERLRDLAGGADLLKLHEAHRLPALERREHSSAAALGDLPRFVEESRKRRAVTAQAGLVMPRKAKLAHVVDSDLGDLHVEQRRDGATVVTEPQQPHRLPPRRLEARAERLRVLEMIEGDAPVREIDERAVGDGANLFSRDRRRVLDEHEVEVVVGRIASRSQDPAVLPALVEVAGNGVGRIAPGASGDGTRWDWSVDGGFDQSRSALA